MSGAAGGAYGRFPCKTCSYAFVTCNRTECEECKIARAEGEAAEVPRRMMDALPHGSECRECTDRRKVLQTQVQDCLAREAQIRMEILRDWEDRAMGRPKRYDPWEAREWRGPEEVTPMPKSRAVQRREPYPAVKYLPIRPKR